jgi:hypothetical protein
MRDAVDRKILSIAMRATIRAADGSLSVRKPSVRHCHQLAVGTEGDTYWPSYWTARLGRRRG